MATVRKQLRPQRRGAPRTRPTRVPGRGVQRTPNPRLVRPAARLPRTVVPEVKPWVSLTRTMARRLIGGVVGAVIDPTPTASPSQDAPPGRENFTPRPRPTSNTEDPKGNTGNARNAPPRRGRLGGRLPDPAVERALKRAKSDKDLFRLRDPVLGQVAPTKISDKLDAVVGRPVEFKAPEIRAVSAKRVAKLERKRKARKARKQAVRAPEPKPVSKPAKPVPKPVPRPTPKPAQQPAVSKPVQPKPGPGVQGGGQPSLPKPLPTVKPTPVSPPAVVPPPTPAVPPASKPNTPPVAVPPPAVEPDPVAPEQPQVGQIMWPEVSFNAELGPDGRPRLRVRTRNVRDRLPRRERDKKVRTGAAALMLHSLVTHTWGAASEIQDFWEIFVSNLYTDHEAVAGKGRRFYGDQLPMTDEEFIRAFINGSLELDLAGFIRDFAFNQLEDAIIGRLNRGITDALIRAGAEGNITTVQRLNALRRTAMQEKRYALLPS